MNWSVYILECSDRSLYCGIATDVKKRIAKHESGLGAKYTRGRGPFKLLYIENFDNHADAARREYQIKKWRRGLKENLIRSQNPGYKLKNSDK